MPAAQTHFIQHLILPAGRRFSAFCFSFAFATAFSRNPVFLRALVPWWFNPVFDPPPRHEDTKNAA